MRAYKRWVLLSAVVVLSLLARICIPVSISAVADTSPVSTTVCDLIIDAIIWSPEVPLINNMVTFTVTIRNQGNGQAGSSHVAYYIDDAYQISVYVDPIDPGARATETFTWKAKGGSHTIKAVADVLNQVNESNESNNDKTFAFPVLAPDLAIQDITWSPENPSIGDRVVFIVSIRNQGSSRAGFSNVDLCIDGNSRGYRGVPGIDASATVNSTFIWRAQAGSHIIKVVADILNQVKEGDESNNEKTITYSTAAPDLIIQDVTWSPASPSEGSLVIFTITIKNQGVGKARYSWLAYYIDDICQNSLFVSGIDTGATANVTCNWTAQAGPHTVKAIADCNSGVMESDETNNAKTVALPTLAPDLVIQNITWSPASPLIGHSMGFTVTIKNQGKSSAGYSWVYFYIDDSNRFQQNMGGIDAGVTVTITFAWIAQAGSHAIKAVADGENYINESDESNNTKTVTLGTSRPPLSDLTVQNIIWSPGKPSAGDNVTFSITVKNQGSNQANPSYIACYIDVTLPVSVPVHRINAGNSVTETFTWVAQAGSHTVKAVADSSNVIDESDETNNEKTATLDVSAPDLVIQGISWSPVGSAIRDSVTFTVTIKNQGNFRAGRSYLAYYIDGSSRGYHDVPEIDAGATATRAFNWSVQTGSHTIKVVADMGNQVLESNEDNNEKAVNLSIPSSYRR